MKVDGLRLSGRKLCLRTRLPKFLSGLIGWVLGLAAGLWLVLGAIFESGMVSWVRGAVWALTLLSIGVFLSVPSRLGGVRLVAAAAFTVFFLLSEIMLTADARWEAEQRTRGVDRAWR